jgi:hypothetical protein
VTGTGVPVVDVSGRTRFEEETLMDLHADDNRSRAATPRRARRAGLVGLVAVGALLAGACGSSSMDSSSTGGLGTAAPRAATEPTAGSGGGWSDCGTTCTFEGDVISEESLATEDAGKAPVSPTTAPGVLPLTGGSSASAPVTAGSVDDNVDWDEYLRYRQEFDAKGIAADRITVEGRQVFRVVDSADQPVLGATIEVRDGRGATAATLTTYADGRALFHPPTTVDPNSQQRPRYTATVRKGSATQEVSLDPSTRSYDVRLVTAATTEPVSLDVVFLIDTTGSMGDEIDRLKANISSMTEKISALPAAPDVRYGMTLYRDQGDLFDTRSFELTGDLGAFSDALDEVQADGGGDTPEDLNAGLRDALDLQPWRGEDTVKLVFVVADAPPHLDYAGSTSYATSVVQAAARGVKVLPIGASGLDEQGEYVMRQLAQVTLGRFVFLTYGVDGASPGESTPMNVERDQYSVLPLDELVVQLVADELEPLRR